MSLESTLLDGVWGDSSERAKAGFAGPGAERAVSVLEPVSSGAAKKSEAQAGIDFALNLMPCAAAVCDSAWRLERANDAFWKACSESRPRLGERLDAFFPLSNGGLLGGEHVPDQYPSVTSAGHFTVCIARRASGIGVMIQPGYQPKPDQDEQAVDAKLTGEVLLSLSHELALATNEEDLVAAMAGSLKRLFPHCYFGVRLVDPRSCAITSIHIEGRLLAPDQERLVLSLKAAQKARLSAHYFGANRIELIEDEPLIFDASSLGMAVPLAAAGQFFGLINLEYPPGLNANLADDERLLIQLANHSAVGARNVKLIDELTFVRKYFEEIIENANALILAVNRQCEVIIFNKALVGLSGYARSDVIGQGVELLIAERERAGLLEILDKCMSGEATDHFETVLKTRDGTERNVTFSTATVTPLGEVEGAIAIGQDLSTQRQLEWRMMQAEKLASLGQLAAGVAHEINNPLTTINLYAESLLHHCPVRAADPRHLEKLKSIKESAERILRFARDLTTYARPTSNRCEEIDLHEVLDQATRYCEHTLKKREADLHLCYGQVPRIHGVRANLVQVFVNLLTNACHALPDRGGNITLNTRPKDDGIEIRVSDTGSGINSEVLPRIFEPFFTTKPEGQGTGLGLAIVQGIVQKHGGTVQAASATGKGTVFTIWLPIHGPHR